MKQYITESQLGELSTQAKKDLHKWWKKKGYELDDEGYYSMPLLSIGQMIEFLDEKYPISIIGHQSQWHGGKWYWHGGGIPKELSLSAIEEGLVQHEHGELCDALWEAVKQVLEKE